MEANNVSRAPAISSQAQSANRYSVGLAVLIAVGLYAALFPLMRSTLSWQTSDFTACYRAGQMVANGQGEQVYDYEAAKGYSPNWQAELAAVHEKLVLKRFVSAPFVLLIFAPLSHLSHYQAEIVWYVVNVGLMLAWPLLLRDVLGRGKLLVFALLAPIAFVPLIVGMVQGQTSTLTLFLFALCYASLLEGRALRAGSVLALAAIKPQFVLPMLLALVVAKNWRAVVGFLGASLGLSAISAALVGWRTALSYPAAWVRYNVLPREMGGAHVEGMPNIRGMLYVLLHGHASSPVLVSLTLGATALLVVMVVVAVRREGGICGLVLPFVITVALLSSYYCYLFDLSLLMLAFVLVMRWIGERDLTPKRTLMLLTIFSFYAIPFLSGNLDRMIVYLFFATMALAIELFAEIAGEPAPSVIAS
jgi:hypothetical protein